MSGKLKIGLVLLSVIAVLSATAAAQVTVTRNVVPDVVEPNGTITVYLNSTPIVGIRIIEMYPVEFELLNWSYESADSVTFSQENNTLMFVVSDLSTLGDGFTIWYTLKAPAEVGVYYFNGTYEPIGENVTAIGGDNKVTVSTEPEIVIKNVTVEPKQITLGESVNVTIEVCNEGLIDGSKNFTVVVVKDGQPVKSINVPISVPAGVCINKTFPYTPTSTGNYTISVDGVSDSFTVTGLVSFELQDVSVPAIAYQYQTVDITGVVKNTGTSQGEYIVALFVDSQPTNVLESGTLAPNESTIFTLSYSFDKAGTHTVEIKAIVKSTMKVTDSFSAQIDITPDEDMDKWNDTVEQIIAKYYNFDWMNQTPTKEIIAKSLSSAAVQYMLTEDPAKKAEIVSDVTAIVNEYFMPR